MWVAKRGQLFGRRISSLCRQGKGREMGTKQMLARPVLAFVQLLSGLKARQAWGSSLTCVLGRAVLGGFPG